MTHRDPKKEGGGRNPKGPIFRAINGNVRRSSSLALAENEVEARSIPTPQNQFGGAVRTFRQRTVTSGPYHICVSASRV